MAHPQERAAWRPGATRGHCCADTEAGWWDRLSGLMPQVLTHDIGARHPSSDPRLLTTGGRTVCRHLLTKQGQKRMCADPPAAAGTKPSRGRQAPLDPIVPSPGSSSSGASKWAIAFALVTGAGQLVLVDGLSLAKVPVNMEVWARSASHGWRLSTAVRAVRRVAESIGFRKQIPQDHTSGGQRPRCSWTSPTLRWTMLPGSERGVVHGRFDSV